MKFTQENNIAFQQNPLPILILETQTGNIVDFNIKAKEFFDFQDNNLDDRNIYSLFKITERAKIKANIELLKKDKKESVNFTYVNRLYDKFEIKIVSSSFTDEQRNYMFLFVKDIQKKIKTNSRYEILHDLMKEDHVAVIELDNELNSKFYDKEVNDILDCEGDKFQFKRWLKSLEQRDQDLIRKKIDKLSEQGSSSRIIINQSSKENCDKKFLLKIDGVFEGKRLKRILFIIADLSHTISIITELEEKKIFIEKIADQSPSIIYVYDIKKKRNIYINRDLREILGYSKEELPEESTEIVKLLIHPEDKIHFEEYKLKTKTWSEEYTQEFQMRLLTKNGTWKWFVGHEREFLREDNQILSIIGILTDITEIKNAEERLKQAQEIAHLGYWFLNLKTNILNWSQEVYNIFEVKNEGQQINSEFFLSFVPKEEQEVLNTALKNHIEKGSEYKVEHRIILTNGKIKYVQERCKAEFDKAGNAISCSGTVLDISELVKMQKELKKSMKIIEEREKIFEHVVSNSSSIIWKADIDENKKFVNVYISDVVDEFLSLPKGTINNNWDRFFEYVHPEFYSKIEKTFERAFRNLGERTSCDYKVTKADQTDAWFLTSGQALFENGKLTVYGSTSDISIQKKIEAALRESEEKYRSIFENAPLGILHYNAKGAIVSCNDNFVKIIGTSKEEIIGIDMLKLQDKELVRELKKSLNGEVGVYENEYKSMLVNKITPVHGFFQPMYSEDNVLTGGVGIIEDITDRKLIEEKLKKQNEEYAALNEELRKLNEDLLIAKEKVEQSDRLKTEFLHNLSHEIRTPMNGIIGFAEMLNEDNLEIAKIPFYSKMILNSSRQLLRVIDDILEISRLETKQVVIRNKEISINNFLDNMFSVFDFKAKERSIRLRIKKAIKDQESFVRIDDVKLYKIISNLMENAFKYTSKGFVEIGNYIENNKLCIYVKDTGLGIAKEKQKRIFERFQRAVDNMNKVTEGMGLGLAIAKENAKLLNGDILVDSEEGQGTVFTLVLPYNKIQKQIKEKNKMDTSIQNKKILIAEDEEVNFVYLELLIRKKFKNLDIFFAENGKEAVNICEKEDVCLVFMDVKMPVMNGLDATREIMKFKPDLPIIGLTAYSTEEDREMVINAGCVDFISKPIDKQKVFHFIEFYTKK